MKELTIKEPIIYGDKNRNNKDIKKLGLEGTMFVCSSAFAGCENLTDVYFGLDITRIGNRAFADCKNLTDVWFAIVDEDKFIEIGADAFDGCEKPITFHIFVTAKKNPYLNKFAREHGFRVDGMI